MTLRMLLLLVALVAAAACDETLTGPTTPLNREFTLAPGETAAIEDASVSVRFNRITGDNRCPGDAVCILGGSADVHVTVRSERSTADYVLKTGDMQPVQHDAYTVKLVQVMPYPFSSRPIQPDDYRVTLTVTR